jgi:hypothetical protein
MVAVLCAVAFLTVGMAHALNDCDGIGSGSEIVLLKKAADLPAGKTVPAVPCDHCYGCTGAMDAPPCATAIVGRVETDYIVAAAAALHPHGPLLHTPPPKFLT